MNITNTPLPGLVIIDPFVFEDKRGYFFETYQKQMYFEKGIDVDFIQDNESRSERSVIRGLHYQINPYAQAKLVRVVVGQVLDVALDLRKGSPTFGKSFAIILDEKSKKQLFIPRGFAHGFSVLSETAVFSYKCDNFYNKEFERCINLNDPLLKIDWKIELNDQKVSQKDLSAPFFADAEMNFIF